MKGYDRHSPVPEVDHREFVERIGEVEHVVPGLGLLLSRHLRRDDVQAPVDLQSVPGLYRCWRENRLPIAVRKLCARGLPDRERRPVSLGSRSARGDSPGVERRTSGFFKLFDKDLSRVERNFLCS